MLRFMSDCLQQFATIAFPWIGYGTVIDDRNFHQSEPIPFDAAIQSMMAAAGTKNPVCKVSEF